MRAADRERLRKWIVSALDELELAHDEAGAWPEAEATARRLADALAFVQAALAKLPPPE